MRVGAVRQFGGDFAYGFEVAEEPAVRGTGQIPKLFSMQIHTIDTSDQINEEHNSDSA
jgi:hypothetical protein